MDLVATQIKLSLSGLFGKSGRYYEFSRPLELIVEQVEDECWMHRIEELNLWAAEPTRAESSICFAQLFDEYYELVGLPGLELTEPAAIRQREQLLKLLKHVY